jgi:hypothetical protein
MVTTAYLGDLGSGKTTKCTRDTILNKQMHPNKKIYSNVHFNNLEYEQLDLMDLYLNHPEIRDTIIVCDEFYTTMDCRVSGSYRNRVESYFIAMTRKAKADVNITMQYETFTDCRLSPFIKVKYIMETIPVKHLIYIDGKEFTYVKPHPYMFKCHLYDDRNECNPITKDFIFDGRRWFNEFNTEQYIQPPEDVINRIKIKQMKDKIQLDKLTKIVSGEKEDVKKPKKNKVLDTNII